MRLEKLADALYALRGGFGLDGTDVMVLGDVMRLKKSAGEVTIMEIVDGACAASPATIHARIKRLCDEGLLAKVEREGNMRYKLLEQGPRYIELVKILGEI